MSSICIVGAGVTGLLLLLLFQEAGVDMSKITIIDPHFDGGDLARKWTAVQSNTPLSKTINAIQAILPNVKLPPHGDTSKTTPLVELPQLIRILCAKGLSECTQIHGTCLESNYDSSSSKWTVRVATGSGIKEILSDRLVFTQGSEPRTLDIPIPSIPLEIAIDEKRLQHYVRPGQRVMVFGTMHSGTLIIRNASNLGATVTAMYNSDAPFYWDRDGVYDGIKREAAEIADDIVAGKIPVSLVPVQDTAKVIRASRDADWVVYAMGFSMRESIKVSVDGVAKSIKGYDGSTGKLREVPAWGFGIAYPNRAPDGVHWDVSVAAFLEHMKPQIPSILSGI